MATNPRTGEFRISVNGAWDIEDLLNLADSLAESYGYFYALIVTEEEIAQRLQAAIQKQFWSGDTDIRRFGKHLYGMVPNDDGLKIKSFVYHSPGSLDLVGVLAALWMAARVARAWIAAGTEFTDLLTKIQEFFEKRKGLKKAKTTTIVDDRTALDLDEARALVFSVGDKIGFDTISCERIIELVGNPISALKLLSVLSREARKLAELEQTGLLHLPKPPNDPVTIAKAMSKITETGVKVIRRRRKKRGPQQV